MLEERRGRDWKEMIIGGCRVPQVTVATDYELDYQKILRVYHFLIVLLESFLIIDFSVINRFPLENKVNLR